MNNVLLDKGVIRKLIESFNRAALDLDLTSEQEQVSTIFRHIVTHDEAFISIETYNILKTRFSHQPFFDVLKQLIEVVIPIRYKRRWSRRLRSFGFSREDAWQIAMSSFCTNKIIQGELIKIDIFLTLDKNLVNKYQNNISEIASQFIKMTSNLNFPFSMVTLPEVIILDEFKL